MSSPLAPQPQPGCCALFLPKKGRYCHFAVVEGHGYCGHHLQTRDSEQGTRKKRIPCPLDPTHTIFAKDVDRHMRVCPRAKEGAIEAALPCFERNCNLGGAGPTGSSSALDAPRSLGAVLTALRAAHAASAISAVAPPPQPQQIPRTPSTEAEGRGKTAQKHAVQHFCLLQVLLRSVTSREDAVTRAVIELGAGKGGLSAAISEIDPASSYVLVDWSKPHGSVDTSLRERGVGVTRYKIDLAHLVLRGVAELQWPRVPAPPAPHTDPPDSASAASTTVASSAGSPIDLCQACETPAQPVARVAVAKHLCGRATDFALRSIVDAANGDSSDGPAMQAIMIATCCHHRCTWSTYCGRQLLCDLGFGERDFALLALISSWATVCDRSGDAEGSGRSSPTTATGSSGKGAAVPTRPAELDGSCEHSTADTDALRQLEQSLDGQFSSSAARRELGRMCKRLLDQGRLRYLQQHGYCARMQAYVSEDVTPENVVIIAEPAERSCAASANPTNKRRLDTDSDAPLEAAP